MTFQGLYTAILTPFTAGGERIDFDAYSKLLENQIRAGVSGVVPCGTTGESPTLSHSEHEELIRKTVEFVNGRCSVIAGTGSNSTNEACRLTESACKDGVDAVMLVNPYYNKPTQEGLYLHFKTISAASSVPVILYNIQGRTAVNIEPETVARLAEIENIKGIKEASGNPGQMARIIQMAGDKLSLLSGDDNITPAVMGLGGNGVISVASNLYPAMLGRMVQHYLNDEFETGNKIFYRLLPFMNSMFWQTNPIPVKTAASIKGICNPDLRLPLVAPASDFKARLKEIMDQLGPDQ